jgi:hypothetical protein
MATNTPSAPRGRSQPAVRDRRLPGGVGPKRFHRLMDATFSSFSAAVSLSSHHSSTAGALSRMSVQAASAQAIASGRGRTSRARMN